MDERFPDTAVPHTKAIVASMNVTGLAFNPQLTIRN